jgi:hypothetical protein
MYFKQVATTSTAAAATTTTTATSALCIEHAQWELTDNAYKHVDVLDVFSLQ